MPGMTFGWPLIGAFALLVALGWLVPQALGRVLPEGAGWLVANGALSALVLAALAAGGFALSYGPAAGEVWARAPWHFARLSAQSALIWMPVVVLSVADLPRRWKEREW
jgi:hypothetical protein